MDNSSDRQTHAPAFKYMGRPAPSEGSSRRPTVSPPRFRGLRWCRWSSCENPPSGPGLRFTVRPPHRLDRPAGRRKAHENVPLREAGRGEAAPAARSTAVRRTDTSWHRSPGARQPPTTRPTATAAVLVVKHRWRLGSARSLVGHGDFRHGPPASASCRPTVVSRAVPQYPPSSVPSP